MIDTIPGSHHILESAQALQDSLVSWRRHIHSNPELSFGEKQTATYVADQMTKLGYKVRVVADGTGVIAEIGNANTWGTVGIRADMDALPIEETNTCQYASKSTGVMHACGHDAHTACALGAAKLISELHASKKLQGCIRFLFQPAEEKVNSDNKSGATLLMEAGATDGLKALLALHVFPNIPTGVIGICPGTLLAAADSFTATLSGKGCHGAFPEQGTDAIVLAAQAIQALQTVVSRRLGANEVGVVTIGGIRSKTFAPNIIPESVEIVGTARYLDHTKHEFFRTEIERALSVVNALGGNVTLDYNHETPALINDPVITAVVQQTVEDLLGASAVLQVPPQLGADDFAYYTQQVPSCYFVLGVAIDGSPRDLHTATFDINEEALPLGSAILTESALRLLKSSAN